MQTLAQVFAEDGALLRGIPGLVHRPGQQEMAERISAAMATGEPLVIEAGTGIGKTFAYLVPVLLSGQRAIVSTGTRTLQDQLMDKDLPALSRAIGRPARVAVLKGRSNYLCWHRLNRAQADASAGAATRDLLIALRDWAEADAVGDLSVLQDLDADASLRSRITSTVDNCLGAQCDFYAECFVATARRQAIEADIVVVNHHLLLADLALKETGFGDLLGNADTVIVDEAHMLPDIAQQFFATSASTGELDNILRDVHAEVRAIRLPPDRLPALPRLSARIIDLRRLRQPGSGRTPWRDLAPGLLEGWAALAAAAQELASELDAVDPLPAGLARCRDRLLGNASRTDIILGAEAPEEGLRWGEFTQHTLSIHFTPLDTGSALGARVSAQGGVWIWTSATLAVGEDFDHFRGRAGIGAASTAVVESPFDYGSQAALYVPEGLPEPASAGYTNELLGHVWPLIRAARGGAFLLFTSYRALEAAADWIALREAPGPVLVQGSGPRSALLEAFRAHGNAVLLGTGSFWQGVDVQGRALRLVVIDKLPFAAPNDPYTEARIQAIQQSGGNPFMEFQVPQAVLALKQGFGRLIRGHEDVGLVVLGDPRLRTRRYGRIFLDSLPPAGFLDSFESALAFSTSLGRGSDYTGPA